ncbi:hypothetical protein JQ506_23900 (plasmid) [Shinella sp. PSBB067]|uniref:hypothetical protein n=1 Tax=Shinella sp. PSBB067 TaxID=2715959 RepID=UPI00193C6A2A|nr:hypothetical protein [Shinella sp. PSBB067]QRI66404.1 hypothetical protein JQ506_23900 [Shinella sp. PSBB067]
MTDRQEDGGRPDLVRNYRPVAIRSVVAAHAMIVGARPGVPPVPEASPASPPGFHGAAEDEQ